MKRALLPVMVLLLFLTACGKETVSGEKIDLTAMTGAMVYAQVSNIASRPEEFKGRPLRMQGIMSEYTDPKTGTVYRACVIADATACCSQGLEFTMADGNYPPVGKEITVDGVISAYQRGRETVSRIENCVLVEP